MDRKNLGVVNVPRFWWVPKELALFWRNQQYRGLKSRWATYANRDVGLRLLHMTICPGEDYLDHTDMWNYAQYLFRSERIVSINEAISYNGKSVGRVADVCHVLHHRLSSHQCADSSDAADYLDFEFSIELIGSQFICRLCSDKSNMVFYVKNLHGPRGLQAAVQTIYETIVIEYVRVLITN